MLDNLEEELSALSETDTIGQLRALLRSSTTDFHSDRRIDELSTVLRDTLINIIAIGWSPDGGGNHLESVVQDIASRRDAHMKELKKTRSRSPSVLSVDEPLGTLVDRVKRGSLTRTEAEASHFPRRSQSTTAGQKKSGGRARLSIRAILPRSRADSHQYEV